MRVFGSSSFHSFNLEFRSKAHRATLDQELTLFQKLLMLLDLFPSNQSFLITALAQKIYLITVAQRKAEGELKNFNDVFPKSSPKLKLTLRRCLLAQLQFQLSTTPHLASSFFSFLNDTRSPVRKPNLSVLPIIRARNELFQEITISLVNMDDYLWSIFLQSIVSFLLQSSRHFTVISLHNYITS